MSYTYASVAEFLRVPRENWVVHHLYEVSKGSFDWSPLLDELNAYVENGIVKYYEIPRNHIIILKQTFPELKDFSVKNLSGMVGVFSRFSHEREILQNAIQASRNYM